MAIQWLALVIFPVFVGTPQALAHDRPYPVVEEDYCRYILESGRPFLFLDELPGDGKLQGVTAYADSAGRRTWGGEERSAVQRWLSVLTARSDLQRFIARIHHQGSRHLYRLGRGVERVTSHPAVFAPLLNADTVVAEFVYEFERHNYQAGITFYDLFFRTFVGLSPDENDHTKMRALFHELLHAFDGPGMDYSHHDEFLSLVGWRPHVSRGPSTRKVFELKGTSPEAVRCHLERLNIMGAEGRIHEVRAESRRLGRALGLPGIYAALNPSECFAVVGDAILFDPEAPSYLSPEVIAWYRRNVLR